MTSLMPAEAYVDPNFEWDYGEEWNAKRPEPRR
jgi:hypothetical protein